MEGIWKIRGTFCFQITKSKDNSFLRFFFSAVLEIPFFSLLGVMFFPIAKNFM